MIKRLIVNHGNRERELTLVGTIVVGRDPECDVSEDGDSLLSRRHSEFSTGPDGVTVRDLGSRNGTLVNGVKIVSSVIRPGDVVQIGHLLVRYVEGDAPVPPLHQARQDPDDAVTRVVLAPRAPAAAGGVPSPMTAGSAAADDPTRVIPRPGPGGSRSPGADAVPVRSAPARLPDGDDPERTRVVKSPQTHAPTPSDATVLVAPPVPLPVRAAAPALHPASRGDVSASASSSPAVRGRLSRYVFVQVSGVAAVVLCSTALAMVLGGDTASAGNGVDMGVLWQLAPATAIAAGAAYAAGTLINRRLALALESRADGHAPAAERAAGRDGKR